MRPWVGSTNRPVFVKRRQRMSQAAVRLFTEHAYADVHMDAIAAAAGVAKPTLYRYFATKEALFIEALECALEELRDDTGRLKPAQARSRVACAGSWPAYSTGSAV